MAMVIDSSLKFVFLDRPCKRDKYFHYQGVSAIAPTWRDRMIRTAS